VCACALAIAAGLDSASANAAPRRRVRWQWQRFQPFEYVATPLVAAGAFALRFGAKWNPQPNITDGILADDWFFRHAYPQNQTAFTAWRVSADIAYRTSFVWSLADPLIAGAANDWDVGSQMLFVNLEAYATYSMVLWGTQYFVRRRRPVDRPCDGRDGARS